MDRIEMDKSGFVFSDVSWVASAVSKDPGRYALTCICVQDGWVVATDGHRLHAVYFEENMRPDWEDGLYRILVNKKSELVAVKDGDTGKFPDWLVLFKEHRPVASIDFHISPKGIDGPYAKTIRMLPDDLTINYKFFSDLGDAHYEAFYYGEGPVYFMNDRRLAAIMPLCLLDPSNP